MAKITISRALLDLLRERRIADHFGGGERWQAGQPLYLDADCELEPYCEILGGQILPRRMGAFSYTGSSLAPSISIGRYCSIGPGVEVVHTTHPTDWATSSPFSYSPSGHPGLVHYWKDVVRGPGLPTYPYPKQSGPIEIGHDVWVGQGAMFTRGVKVGNGAIIGARAVVTRDVPAYAIVGGSPARVIRMRLADTVAERLEASRWWRYGPDVLHGLDPRDPAAFVDRLEARLADDPPPVFAPRPLTAAEIMAVAADTAS